MDKALDVLLGQISQVKMDMETMVFLIKDMEALDEYRGNTEHAYEMKALLLMANQIKEHAEEAFVQVKRMTEDNNLF